MAGLTRVGSGVCLGWAWSGLQEGQGLHHGHRDDVRRLEDRARWAASQTAVANNRPPNLAHAGVLLVAALHPSEKYKSIVTVPSDPHTQLQVRRRLHPSLESRASPRLTLPPSPLSCHLQMAIKAVFSSWYTPRAKRYRQYNDIPDDLGTAVNIQSMVRRHLHQ